MGEITQTGQQSSRVKANVGMPGESRMSRETGRERERELCLVR